MKSSLMEIVQALNKVFLDRLAKTVLGIFLM